MIRFSLIIFLLLPSFAFGATYYVDFSGGNDTSAGAAEGTAWKTLPGTRNTGDTGWETTDWGSGIINSSSKIQAGDIIRIKPGTTHDSSNGGRILINSTYYATDATAATPIKFVSYQAWSGASGSVTIDGTGITISGGQQFGLVGPENMSGVEFDGQISDGFIVRDSAHTGISWLNDDADSRISEGDPLQDGAVVRYTTFLANLADAVYDSGDGQRGSIQVDYHDNVAIENVDIDCNDRYGVGIKFGASDAKVIGELTNVTIYDCKTTVSLGNGAGVLALNSELTLDNYTVYGCNKGGDYGEDNGNGAKISITMKNSKAYNNAWGSNFNIGPSYAGTTEFILFNNLIYDNTIRGIDIYAEPWTAYIVHNTFDNNGSAGPANPERGNIGLTGDNKSATFGTLIAYVYNNIFYKPGGGSNLLNERWAETNHDTNIYSDYNSWIQRASEDFASWGYFGDNAKAYPYGGTTGPGDNTLDWYTNYGTSDTPPGDGIGHYHADANSYATGGSDSTPPPFTDDASNDYTLTSAYSGTNISGNGWYISAMGTDRSGTVRAGWDIGAYEYVSGASATHDLGSFSGGGSFQ